MKRKEFLQLNSMGLVALTIPEFIVALPFDLSRNLNEGLESIATRENRVHNIANTEF